MTSVVLTARSDTVGLRRESPLDASEVPMWLARLHRALPPGAEVEIGIAGDLPLSVHDLMEGAGFVSSGGKYRREVSLPDTVGEGLRALVVGLNPGLTSADVGVPFAGPSNRFWPAALAAGLVSTDRSTDDALARHRVGFSDLVKRTTRRAEELVAGEFEAGFHRIERLAKWAQPAVVIMVGLTGWRHAADPTAVAGWQPRPLGPSPVYLMPSTSGLNAHETLETLTDHLRIAGDPTSRTGPDES